MVSRASRWVQVIPEPGKGAVGPFEQVWRVEPPAQKTSVRLRGPGIAAVAKVLDLVANPSHQGRHQLVHGGVAHRLVGGKPADRRIEDRVGRCWKIRMQGHVLLPFDHYPQISRISAD